jgi:hypothetical protein
LKPKIRKGKENCRGIFTYCVRTEFTRIWGKNWYFFVHASISAKMAEIADLN